MCWPICKNCKKKLPKSWFMKELNKQIILDSAISESPYLKNSQEMAYAGAYYQDLNIYSSR